MNQIYTDVSFGGGAESFCALIDSGNGFRNLISLRAFRCLNVRLLASNAKAVSIDNSSVQILGKTPVLQMKFKGYDKLFPVQFEVIESMSVDINIGYSFLFENKAVILFCDRNGNRMFIKDLSIPLTSRSSVKQDFINTLLSEESTDFMGDVRNFPGINFAQEGEGIDISDSQKFGVLNYSKTKIPAKSICPIKVSTSDLIKGKVYFTPITKTAYVTKAGILPLEAVYFKDKELYINVLNTNDFDTSLPKDCKLGFAFSPDEPVIQDTPRVSSLDELSTDELRDRIDFINNELGLKVNPITKDNERLRSSIIRIFLDNFNAVATSDNDVGHTDLIKFKINLKDDAKPVNSRNFPLNPDQSAALREQIDRWLEMGVIKPAVSAWNSPIFSVKKKTSVPGKFSLRFVLDFRKLNDCTKTEVYPLPNIDSNISKLGGAKLFSTIDACQAYHSIEVDEDSQNYLAFSGEDGSYAFTRMPFGAKNSANVFQRLMNKALSLVPGLSRYCISYLDDLIIFSYSIDNHLEHLKVVIQLMNKCGIKLKLSKCSIFRESVKYLGHIVSSRDIRMDTYYLERVKSWPMPKSGKEMQSFLGFLNYYRSYLPEFAARTYQLDELRNEKDIVWTDDLISVFEKAKEMFHSSVSKGYPDWNKNSSKFLLDIDWSKHCLSGILSQKQGDKEVLIGCFSRKCSLAESRYSSHKGEASALVFALDKFSHFLRYRPFIVRTDSRSVLTTSNWKTRLLTGVTSRWLEYIATFDFSIVHRPGHLHRNADILSRSPMLDDSKIPDDYKFDPITKEKSEYLDTIYNVNNDSYHLRYVLDTNSWVKETNLDPTLKQIKEWVLLNHKPTLQEKLNLNYRGKQLVKLLDFISVHKGLLIFTQPHSNTEIIRRTIVPLSLYNRVFNFAHNNEMTNHRGMLNTLHFIQKHFCLPYARKYVQARINNCVVCLSKIKNKPKSTHIIESSDFSSVPFDGISVDTVGPLSKCDYRGQTVQHILIVVDLCTRYMFLHPLTDIKTETIITILCEEFVPMFSLFKYLKSDNGPCFVSKIFDGVMARFGINVRHSVVRTPNSNACERYNQNIYALFKTNVFNEGNWADKLKYVMLVYNCSHNYRTSFSPHFLLFKKDPVLPLDLIDPLGKDVSKLNWHSTSFDQFVFKLESTYKIMKENTDRYLTVENAKRDVDRMYVSDLVFFYEDIVQIGSSRKLSSFFIGPFMITKSFSDTLYEITPIPPNPSKRVRTASIDKLRKFRGKVTLGDETVGFNINTSKYINIDSDIQLRYLSDDLFDKHIQQRHNILNNDRETLESFDIEMSSDDEEGEAITHDNMPLSLSKDSVVRSNVQNNVRDSPSEIDTNNSDLPVNDSNLVQTPHLNNNSELTIDEPYSVNNPEANINTDATVEEPILVHKTKMGKSFIQLSRRHKEKSVNTKVSLKDLFEQKRSTRSAPNPKFYSFDMEKPFKYVK